MQRQRFGPLEFPETFRKKGSLRTSRGRRGGREEERVINITLLPEAWGMSPKEVSSSLFDCWNMLSHWENCSFLTCSGEFYCGHILVIYVYKCMCTHTFMHTIKGSIHIHKDSWLLDNRLFSEQLELVFIDHLLWTGTVCMISFCISFYHHQETLIWSGCNCCPLLKVSNVGLRWVVELAHAPTAVLWQSLNSGPALTDSEVRFSSEC